MSTLFSSYQIGDITFKNRLVMPPMCMYQASSEGYVEDFHKYHYATRAMGQCGFMIVEATAITPCGRISDHDLGIWDDAHIEGLASLANIMKQYGAVAGIQINHAGRKCAASEPHIYGPSAVPFSEEYQVPIAMSEADIQDVIELFRSAAKRAEQAGYQYVEVHAAHGYLLSSFLSPLSNQRTDAYGGSYEHRTRFVREVVRAVKQEFHGLVGLRVSASDYEVDGNQVEDIVAMIQLIKEAGVDVIHVSSGGVTPQAPAVYPGYQIHFAQVIKEKCQLPTIGGGLLTSPELMEALVSNQKIDMVFVGRELLRSPYFPLYAANKLKHEIAWLPSYDRAKYR